MSDLPRLHVPSEPDRSVWWSRVMESATVDEVIEKEDGVAPWLWERWRVLESAGVDRARFIAIVTGYRREIWLWLMGERTWAQCCSGLIGRIDRRRVAD
ncbi:MAG TPA: hypothetical protein VN793_07355 [Acidimicrobiales bacterium]|nr:hypothetical protein [Acidimicrobiales bacterium]